MQPDGSVATEGRGVGHRHCRRQLAKAPFIPGDGGDDRIKDGRDGVERYRHHSDAECVRLKRHYRRGETNSSNADLYGAGWSVAKDEEATRVRAGSGAGRLQLELGVGQPGGRVGADDMALDDARLSGEGRRSSHE